MKIQERPTHQNVRSNVGAASSLGPPTLPHVADQGAAELAVRQLSQAQLVVLRFRRHRLAMIGLVMLTVIVVATVVIPFLLPENPYDLLSFDPANSNMAPRLQPFKWVLGTDSSGHAILAQILWGGRISLAVGIISARAVSAIGRAFPNPDSRPWSLDSAPQVASPGAFQGLASRRSGANLGAAGRHRVAYET